MAKYAPGAEARQASGRESARAVPSAHRRYNSNVCIGFEEAVPNRGETTLPLDKRPLDLL